MDHCRISNNENFHEYSDDQIGDPDDRAEDIFIAGLVIFFLAHQGQVVQSTISLFKSKVEDSLCLKEVTKSVVVLFLAE